jgi:hypothetical protein
VGRVMCAVGAGCVGVRGVLGTPTERRLSQTSATWTGAVEAARRLRPLDQPLFTALLASSCLPPSAPLRVPSLQLPAPHARALAADPSIPLSRASTH